MTVISPDIRTHYNNIAKSSDYCKSGTSSSTSYCGVTKVKLEWSETGCNTKTKKCYKHSFIHI